MMVGRKEAAMAEERVDRSADPAVQYLLSRAQAANIETAWDRFDGMQEVCAFGSLGLCCRNCMLGPCRIDPFGEGPQKGICGMSPDGIVARNLCRMIAAGTSAHSDHGAHILEVLEAIGLGEELDYKISDVEKLRQVVASLGLEEGGDGPQDIARRLVTQAHQAFSRFGGESDWLLRAIPEARIKKLRNLHVVPSSIDPVIRETLHRTHIGVDADPLNLLLAALKCSLSDFLAMDVASNLSDILFGTPTPTFSQANLGVLDPEAVNLAVHGHNPLVSEAVLQAAPEFEGVAQEAGAVHGVNIVGICCTGNEVLLRHGVPLATNFASQEIAILTGAVDAMVVDVQCIMPALGPLCECYHTKLITTMPIAKIPGATHIELHPESAVESARRILALAIEAFQERDPSVVNIPDIKQETLVGFSVEAILSLLAKMAPDDPLQPLVDRIVSGDIYGVVLFAGCNNFKVAQDASFIELAEKLAADNVLLLATGCAAGAFAKRGLLSPGATEDICGQQLAQVLTALGHVAGLERPLPPVWHMGSCVDNSRPARLAFALANKLGVDIDQLPVVASAPEAMSEKAVAIGTGAVALGLTTQLGVIPPVLGGKIVTKVLTETLGDLLGATFIVEPDPALAYQRIKETLTERRVGLGLA
jgi:carbon-monoxide dehydrogenase catalytic subunit